MDPALPPLLAELQSQHRSILAALEACEREDPSGLVARLTALRPSVLDHLVVKERFYQELQTLCASHQDPAGGSVARIFESNMKVLSSGINGFFGTLEALVGNPSQLSQRFKTVAQVLRSRLDTEEKAVFPIYQRNTRVET